MVFVVLLAVPLLGVVSQTLLMRSAYQFADVGSVLWASLPRAALSASGPALLGAVLVRVLLRRRSLVPVCFMLAAALPLGEFSWWAIWSISLRTNAFGTFGFDWRWTRVPMLLTPYVMVGATALWMWHRDRRAGSRSESALSYTLDPETGRLRAFRSRVVKLGALCVMMCAVSWGVLGFYIQGTVGVIDGWGWRSADTTIGRFLWSGIGAIPMWMLGGVAVGVLACSFYVPMLYRRCAERSAAHTFGALLVLVNAIGAVFAVLCLNFLSEYTLWRASITLVMLLAFGAIPVAAGYAGMRVPKTWTRFPIGCCQKCGYDRSGIGPAAPCPECGSPASSRLPVRNDDR